MLAERWAHRRGGGECEFDGLCAKEKLWHRRPFDSVVVLSKEEQSFSSRGCGEAVSFSIAFGNSLAMPNWCCCVAARCSQVCVYNLRISCPYMRSRDVDGGV